MQGIEKSDDEWRFTVASSPSSIAELSLDSIQQQIAISEAIIPPIGIVSETASKSATNKAKRKKKSKQKGTAKSSSSDKRSVSWGTATYLYFERDLGYSSVPGFGQFPLGMGLRKVDEETVSIKTMPPEPSISSHQTKQKSSKKQREVLTFTEKQRKDFLSRIPVANHESEEILPLIAINCEIALIQESRRTIGCSCRLLKVDKLSVSND